jgi:RsiW-degrading membrane proteinase PrsW (M82 family)
MADVVLTPTYIAVLLVSAFAVPLLFVSWIRNTKRIGRPPMPTVLKAFAWGAVFSVIIALVVSLLLASSLESVVPLYVFLSEHFQDPSAIIAILMVAPLVEEASKAVGAHVGKRAVRVRIDGLVYGAAAGLGFSATENLFYGIEGIQKLGFDLVGSIVYIAIRSFSSSLLHASSTAVTGYGLATGWLTSRRWAFLPYYLVAVTMHAAFNALASFGQLYLTQFGDAGIYVGFATAVIFAITALSLVRYKLVARSPAPAR